MLKKMPQYQKELSMVSYIKKQTNPYVTSYHYLFVLIYLIQKHGLFSLFRPLLIKNMEMFLKHIRIHLWW